jgi:hypothetical protein
MSTDPAVVIWTELLDAYERTLDEHELAVHDANGVVDGGALAFVPPPVNEPIPETMRARAAALAERTDALIARVGELAATVRPPQDQPRPRPNRSAPTPSFDRRA